MKLTTPLSAPDRGFWGERLAREYLQQQGLTFVTANYQFRGGEIDLIMNEQSMLVFVEVRYRKSSRYGHAAETIDSRKQHRLSQCAEHYLQRHKITQHLCRFDVIAIQGAPESPNIEWIKNAFGA